MSQQAPNAQPLELKLALKKAWDAKPEVRAMSASVGAQLHAEGAAWDEAGFNRAFALINAWEAENGFLPPSGVEANG